MRFNKFLLYAALSATVSLTGCIDNKYDLSNVDTTTEFKVKDLVLPINLEPIVLRDIIKVEEGDQLKDTTINDQTFYAVVQKGDFSSDPIEIDSFEAIQRNQLNDKSAVFIMPSRTTRAGDVTLRLFEEVVEDLKYTNETPIDGALRALNSIYFGKDLVYKINITSSFNISNSDLSLKNVKIEIPKGLKISGITAGGKIFDSNVYDPASGVLSLNEVNMTGKQGGYTTDIEIKATGMDLETYGEDNPFKYNAQTNSGYFELNSRFAIVDSQLVISGNGVTQIGSNGLDFNVSFSLSELDASAVTGSIYYDLDGKDMNIPAIDLENLPTFLADPETDLVLSNPQIYLGLDNPVGIYGLPYQFALSISAVRENDSKSFDSGLIIVSGDGNKRNNFLLCPEPDQVTNIPSEFSSNLSRGLYSGLGQILQGDGLPQKVGIDIVHPEINSTTTSPFYLGKDIHGLKGEYLFLAPLSLKEDSKIVKRVDGWWSDDLKDLYIDYLTLTAKADNMLSTGVIIGLYAINPDGEKISTETSFKLEENALDVPVEISLEGIDGRPFNDLDGLKIYVITGVNQGEPLAPDQYITLDDIRIKVSGNYIKEF